MEVALMAKEVGCFISRKICIGSVTLNKFLFFTENGKFYFPRLSRTDYVRQATRDFQSAQTACAMGTDPVRPKYKRPKPLFRLAYHFNSKRMPD